MGLLSTLGTIGGSLFGGPVGGAIGGALGGAIEGNDQARAAEQAAQTTGAASQAAIDLQRRMYEEGVARQQPWLKAGETALNKLVPLATQYTPFGMSQFQADPGYGFRMSEGMKALERSAAARGGLLSGATLKGVQRYGQDLASQEYQNAFNRYQAEREARLNPLQSLAGVGQTTAHTLGSAGTSYGQNVGNALLNQAYTAGNAGLAAAQARGSTYGAIGSALGQITPGQWSSARTSISNWLSPQAGYGSINPNSGEYMGSLEF
jgi:hypothetical protein